MLLSSLLVGFFPSQSSLIESSVNWKESQRAPPRETEVWMQRGAGRAGGGWGPGSFTCCLLGGQAPEAASSGHSRLLSIDLLPGGLVSLQNLFVPQRVGMWLLAARTPPVLQKGKASEVQRGRTARLRGWAQPFRETLDPCLPPGGYCGFSQNPTCWSLHGLGLLSPLSSPFPRHHLP